MGGCSLIPGRARGGRRRGGKKERSETWLFLTSDMDIDLHKHWLNHRVSEAASGTMRWLCNGEESALCSTMHEEREKRGKREREKERGRERERESAQVETGW